VTHGLQGARGMTDGNEQFQHGGEGSKAMPAA